MIRTNDQFWSKTPVIFVKLPQLSGSQFLYPLNVDLFTQLRQKSTSSMQDQPCEKSFLKYVLNTFVFLRLKRHCTAKKHRCMSNQGVFGK